MGELIKNIGLGLFVNGTFAVMNADITFTTILIEVISLQIMVIGIILEKA